MKYLLKNRLLLLMLLSIVVLVPGITLSRYVYELIKNQVYKTKDFYFKSDLLSEHNPNYAISNWSGVDDYLITINMNSYLNEIVKSSSNIEYEINYKCNEEVECTLSKNKGVIRVNDNTDTNRDFFTLNVHPIKTFNSNESTTVYIETKSTKPYKEKISASFTLNVFKYGLSYEITDNSGDIFSILRLTNSLTYYTIIEEFDNYKIGDEIDQTIYENLTQEKKKKCSSILVNLSFDPRIINLDMTNPYYLQALKDNNYNTIELYTILNDFGKYKKGDLINQEEYDKISVSNRINVSNANNYVNSLKINLEAISSADIKFYKKNKNQNYSYPLINDTSIIVVE